MSYSEINGDVIKVGKALKKELFRKIRDNFIDHEARISSLALGANPIEVFNFPVLNASSANTLTGLTYYRPLSAFTVSTVQIEIFEKNIFTGSLSIDVKKGTSLNPTTFSSILTTQPTINFQTASSYDIASGVLDGEKQLIQQGEYLRLDVTSLPSTPLGKFRVIVYGNI
jgi:hypothetical protein